MRDLEDRSVCQASTAAVRRQLAKPGFQINPITEGVYFAPLFPTYGGLYAWEFEKEGRELQVRVEGRLVFNAMTQILNAALVGFGLAFLPEDLAESHLKEGRLMRVLEDWYPSFPVTISTTRVNARSHLPLNW